LAIALPMQNNSTSVAKPEQQNRHIPLAGGFNFRDLGGYQTRSGQYIENGRIYRSGVMAWLTDTDLNTLKKLNIRKIIDFRANSERESHPTRWHTNSETDIWARDYSMSGADLGGRMQESDFSLSAIDSFYHELYTHLIDIQMDAYRIFFQSLAQQKTPLVFHCTAGKDRTGVAAALLLEFLGVDRETIMQDYLQTEGHMDQMCSLLAKNSGNFMSEHPIEKWQPVMRSKPQYLDAMFAMLDQNYDGAAGYVTSALGLEADAGNQIRSNLLKPA